MERHRCKLCFRRFANGRALAGHMRSHHVVPARAPRPLPSPSPSASSSSPLAATTAEAEEEVKPSAMYALRENRRESFFSSAAAAFQDRGSDTESSIRRWPKRRRRLPAEPPAADEPVSSVSDASTDEDVARCLMLLSRDAWSKCKAEGRHTNGWDEIEGEEYEEEEEEDDDVEDGIGSRSRRPKSRFQCGMCRKVFRSYQALGGHRASHKRVGANCVPASAGMRIHGEDSSGTTAVHHDAKLWECPYCYRVFVSGQALGGHKRSHLSSSAAATASTSPAVPLLRPPSPFTSGANNDTNSGIDLNLPAPDDEAELSVVSIATESARK
ncbi:zinc finger protein ZAT1-like [Musa acuminata AAA Group]|uniref:zinc finger protein ZAT1-like n=1 Tax=Musa acuminata AAA Group TaxID=214697 RepID=UPI0031CDB94E